MNYYYGQIGGAKCSLCGSEGTNKTTCPLNPAVTKPNIAKHPLAAKTAKASSPAKAAKASSPAKAAKAASPVKAAKAAKAAKAPSNDELELINNVIWDLNNDIESGTYWVDDMGPSFVLTMQDLKDPYISEFYVVPPQTYESMIKFSDSGVDVGDFYEFEGKAVTGSGADTWGVYRPGFLKRLTDVRYELEKMQERNERDYD